MRVNFQGVSKRFTSFLSGVFVLDKRQRLVLTTILLTAGVLVSQLIWQDYRIQTVVLLALCSYGLTAWSLSEDIKGIEWFLLFILPVLFTLAVSFFYFLLPARWIMRLVITAVFAIGTYATLLVENIHNVAAQRSIQLLRAAQSVGLLITLVVLFLFTSIVFSLRLPFWENALIITFLSFLLALQSLWSINLEERITPRLIIYAALVSVGIGELTMALSFWPIANASSSLLISASYYSIAGVVQLQLGKRLFANSIREYIVVFIFTFFLALITTRWG